MRRAIAAFSIILSFYSISTIAQSVYQSPASSVVAAAQASFHEYDSGSSLDYIVETVSDSSAPLSVVQSFDPSPGGTANAGSHAYPNAHIKRMVMDSDFVGSATLLKSWSFPTSNDSFVTTIYLAHISQVAVGDGGLVKAGQDIYICRAGGVVNYKGHQVTAADPSFPSFTLNAKFLFFGRKIGPSLYKVTSDGSLEEREGVIRETNSRQAHSSLYSGRGFGSVLEEAFSAWEELPTTTKGRNDK